MPIVGSFAGGNDVRPLLISDSRRYEMIVNEELDIDWLRRIAFIDDPPRNCTRRRFAPAFEVRRKCHEEKANGQYRNQRSFTD
jgi:hypothetical protein